MSSQEPGMSIPSEDLVKCVLCDGHGKYRRQWVCPACDGAGELSPVEASRWDEQKVLDSLRSEGDLCGGCGKRVEECGCRLADVLLDIARTANAEYERQDKYNNDRGIESL